jgi:hypothetical protein
MERTSSKVGHANGHDIHLLHLSLFIPLAHHVSDKLDAKGA